MAGKDARGRGGRRGVTLLILTAVIAVLLAWLGNCFPGLGGGGGGAPASDASSPPPAPAQPAEDAAPPGPIEIAVKGEECRRDDEAPVGCAALCDALPTDGASERRVVVDATLGTHAAVEALRACLREAGFTQVVVRTE